MKYVGVDKNIVITDVLNLDPDRVANRYVATFISVEGLDTLPSRGDIYDDTSKTFSEGEHTFLDAISSRSIRDACLKSSDWVMLKHGDGGFEGDEEFSLEEWKTYRNALRSMSLPTLDDEPIERLGSTFPIRPLHPKIKGL